MKMMGLRQQYALELDNIFMLGDKVANVANPQFAPWISDDARGIPKADVPAAIAAKNFNDLNKGEIYTLMTAVVNSVTNRGLQTFAADTLFMDLASYTRAMEVQGGDSGQSDSNALTSMMQTGNVGLICPVAAWTEAYPDKTTMVALHNSPTVAYGAMPLPLTYHGISYEGGVVKIEYFFRTGGMSFNNALGLVQHQQNKEF